MRTIFCPLRASAVATLSVQIVACALLLAVVAHAVHRERRPPEPAAGGVISQAGQVGLAELLMLLRHNDVLCIDVRPAAEYARGRIPGSISLSFDELERGMGADTIARYSNIVVYCDGRTCLAAARAVHAIKQKHNRAALLYRGGWNEWVSAGLPASTGSETAVVAASRQTG